jgi:hypothetical protein
MSPEPRFRRRLDFGGADLRWEDISQTRRLERRIRQERYWKDFFTLLIHSISWYVVLAKSNQPTATCVKARMAVSDADDIPRSRRPAKLKATLRHSREQRMSAAPSALAHDVFSRA